MLSVANDVSRLSEIKLDFCDVWLGDDGIVRVNYILKTSIDLHKVQQVSTVIKQICDGVSRPFFTDARNMISLDREARQHLAADDFSEWVIAVATLQTPVIKMLAGVFLKFNKPSYPIKLFTSKSEAISWLKEYI